MMFMMTTPPTTMNTETTATAVAAMAPVSLSQAVGERIRADDGEVVFLIAAAGAGSRATAPAFRPVPG